LLYKLERNSYIAIQSLLAHLPKGTAHIDCERTILVVKIAIEEVGEDGNLQFNHHYASARLENATGLSQECQGLGQVVQDIHMTRAPTLPDWKGREPASSQTTSIYGVGMTSVAMSWGKYSLKNPGPAPILIMGCRPSTQRKSCTKRNSGRAAQMVLCWRTIS
jgi:hypothetical protein